MLQCNQRRLVSQFLGEGDNINFIIHLIVLVLVDTRALVTSSVGHQIVWQDTSTSVYCLLTMEEVTIGLGAAPRKFKITTEFHFSFVSSNIQLYRNCVRYYVLFVFQHVINLSAIVFAFECYQQRFMQNCQYQHKTGASPGRTGLTFSPPEIQKICKEWGTANSASSKP